MGYRANRQAPEAADRFWVLLVHAGGARLTCLAHRMCLARYISGRLPLARGALHTPREVQDSRQSSTINGAQESSRPSPALLVAETAPGPCAGRAHAGHGWRGTSEHPLNFGCPAMAAAPPAPAARLTPRWQAQHSLWLLPPILHAHTFPRIPVHTPGTAAHCGCSQCASTTELHSWSRAHLLRSAPRDSCRS